ncbi:PaaI family thioesterase [Virgibacillus sp. FSP13]
MDKEKLDLFTSDPFANRLNIKLLECERGYAKASLVVSDDMLNFYGVAHGGLLFSLADYVFAVASNSHGNVAVGLNVHMSYLAPAKIGDELICMATEIKRTNKIAVYEMKTTQASGDLIGTMEGMVYIKPKA